MTRAAVVTVVNKCMLIFEWLVQDVVSGLLVGNYVMMVYDVWLLTYDEQEEQVADQQSRKTK